MAFGGQSVPDSTMRMCAFGVCADGLAVKGCSGADIPVCGRTPTMLDELAWRRDPVLLDHVGSHDGKGAGRSRSITRRVPWNGVVMMGTTASRKTMARPAAPTPPGKDQRKDKTRSDAHDAPIPWAVVLTACSAEDTPSRSGVKSTDRRRPGCAGSLIGVRLRGSAARHRVIGPIRENFFARLVV